MKRSDFARLAALAVAASLATACAEAPTSAPEAASPEPSLSQASGQEASDHFVVAFNGQSGRLADAVADLGGTLLRTHDEIGVALVTGLDDDGADALRSSAGISRVTRDLIVSWIPDVAGFELQDADLLGHVVSDPTTAFFFPCQWNMSQTDCPAAWAAGYFGDPNVKVAVLDTGVDPNHQDLAGRIDLVNSVSMLSSPSVCDGLAPDQGTILDFNFHGSFVSGIIAANGLGVAGVAPDATIVGVKVLNCTGGGSFADVIAGILYAANVPGVEVINMSLGARFPKNAPGAGPLMASLNKAVNYANSRGVLVVSSAGNEGVDLDHDRNFVNIPAQSGAGIAAWAGDIDGGLASYSNHGRSGAWVGAGGGDATPGSPQIPLPGCVLPASGQGGIVSVCSTSSLFFGCGPSSYLFGGTGTSFSAPLVSGVAALIDGQAGGALNGGQLKTKLAQSADDIGKKGVDNSFSHGRVNASSAVGN